MPCEALRVLAASTPEPRTSRSVLSTDTTVSSESARTGWLCPPPGRLATRWGTACFPVEANALGEPASLALFIHAADIHQTHPAGLCCARRWPGCGVLRTWRGPRGRCRGPAVPSARAGPSPGAEWPGCSVHTKHSYSELNWRTSPPVWLLNVTSLKKNINHRVMKSWKTFTH